MKRILIGGCSFSEYISDREYPWIPWTQLLSHNDLDITNLAKSSYGQPKISETLTDEILDSVTPYDLVIVQWSGVSRGYKLIETPSLNDVLELTKNLNKAHADEIVEGIVNLSHQEYIKRSLTQIYLFQNFLETKKIPYLFFWGWKQITAEHLNDTTISNLISNIYNDNWIFTEKNNGMTEECDSFRRLEDFHPTTKCHNKFYFSKLKPIIEKKLMVNLIGKII